MKLIQNEKGIALFVALMVLIMLTLIGLAAILTTTTEVNIAGNEKQATQALYLAEAGVSAVKAFFENPASFNPPDGAVLCLQADGTDLSDVYCTLANHTSEDPDHTDWASSFFDRRRVDTDGAPTFINKNGESQFLNINYLDANANAVLDSNNFYDDNHDTDTNDAFNGGDRPAMRITDKDYINDTLLGGAFSGIGEITSIEIYPPLLGGIDGNFAVVRVTAEVAGAKRMIEQEIGPSIFIPITAAAQAGGGGSWNGHGSAHWGKVNVERGPDVPGGDPTVSFTNLNNIPCNESGCTVTPTGYDEWFNAYIEGKVDPGGAGWPDPNANDPDTGVPCPDDPLCRTPSSTINIFQNQADVNINRLDYGELKSYAQDNGNYYVVCVAGAGTDPPPSIDQNDAVIHQGSCTDGAGQTFAELTNTQTYDLKFIDWYDTATDTQANTNTPGFTVNQTGNFWTVGNLYLNGDMDWGGSGGGKSTVIEDPDGVESSSTSCLGLSSCTQNVNINGLLYLTGDFKGNGNPFIYGALVAEGGLQSSGTPEMYYNAQFEDGIINLPRTSKQVWRELR